jgi:ABC-type antimicrobial peptide transport system permease subunit
VTIAVAILSLIVIYFTIKSNAMARSEELTVYRLIGISPGSILKAYMLEMALITAYACIPAVLITSGIIKFITSIPSLQIYLLFPWWLALLLIVALFVVNMLISVLPVNSILRQPPAKLASGS